MDKPGSSSGLGKMDGVTEYAEGYDVYLMKTDGVYTFGVPEQQQPGHGRLVVKALNEGGHNSTEVDLLELLAWVKAVRPDLMP